MKHFLRFLFTVFGVTKNKLWEIFLEITSREALMISQEDSGMVWLVFWKNMGNEMHRKKIGSWKTRKGADEMVLMRNRVHGKGKVEAIPEAGCGFRQSEESKLNLNFLGRQRV